MMMPPPLALINSYWFAFPLILVVSVVYAASRHESLPRIARRASRLFVMIGGILVLATAILLLINTQV